MIGRSQRASRAGSAPLAQIAHPWGNFLSRERAELARWLAAAVGLGTVCWLSSQVPVFRAVARAGVKLERPQH
jgi:hypothetical protein